MAGTYREGAIMDENRLSLLEVEKDKQFVSKLEQLGESEVRLRLGKGVFKRGKEAIVKLWLQEKEAGKKEKKLRQELEREARKERREEEALDLSRRANRRAWISLWIAIGSFLLAVVSMIFKRG
jgi:hypothetical protein